MVKHYYNQDYPEKFRGNTARDKNNSLGFYQAVNREQSNQTCGEGRWLLTSC